MNSILLTKENVYAFLRDTIFDIPKNQSAKTRCNDGRHTHNTNELSAFAIPGGDMGQLMIIASSGKRYGFDIDLDASYKILCDIVSGEHNLGFHTDSIHYASKNMWDGCEYIRALRADPSRYGLTIQDIEECLSYFNHAVKRGITPQVLQGEHREGALLVVYGGYGVCPGTRLSIEGHTKEIQVFVHQMNLMNSRHRRLAFELIKQNAVQLHAGCDEEYLYEVFSETAETHLFESIKFQKRGIPVYEVHIDTKTEFDIKEMGIV